MILRNLSTIDNKIIDLVIHPGKEDQFKEKEIDFDNALVFPGLVNSHDHLEFNLFPQLGNQYYLNYTDWGRNLHEQYKAEIEKVLRVPVELRAEWGMYKNLVCGVTTVVNHGDPLVFQQPLINIRQHDQHLHSVRFEKGWKLKLNNPLKRNTTCVIHTGEGTDAAAEKEIDQLIQWNFLQRDLVGIHAIAMTSVQSEYFRALVWCPVSNYFLFNKTASVESFSVPVLFGTDSTLTGSWNIWEHLRFARETGKVSDRQLFDMVTGNGGDVWGLKGYLPGHIPPDLVIRQRDGHQLGLNDFFETSPENILMVLHGGQIRLFDESLLAQLSTDSETLPGFSEVEINGRIKYIQGDLPYLMKEIENCFPEVQFPFHENVLAHD